MTDQPPKPDRISRWMDSIRNLTFTNVAVIVLLALVAVPAYLAWKIINDEELLTIFLSSYQETSLPGTGCSLRIASMRGAGPTYFVSLSYAFSGADRYYLGIHTPDQPTSEQAIAYCEVLNGILNHVAGLGPNPKFPGTDRYVFRLPGLPPRP